VANQEQLDVLKQGVEVWNKWIVEHPRVKVDLRGVDLSKTILRGVEFGQADFSRASLQGADLREAYLGEAIFNGANLVGANLRGNTLIGATFVRADLQGADFNGADLYGNDFSQANLREADFSYAHVVNTDLRGADLSEAIIGHTTFGNIDLSTVKGLGLVQHDWPSTIGIDTIYASHGDIPEAFLKGAGVDDTFITYIRSLVGKAVEYYSCFISYSSKDEAFAKRLYADLQSNNVRCWFAPEHLKIGDKFRHRIDESIRIYDKLLLVLSKASLASTWVGYEVEKVLDKEPEGKPNVLFPIRLDKAILTCETDWAKEIRKSRHIGDFEHWKDHDAYQIAFQRLLRDLKASY
jgi:hypothetical protein